MEESEKTGAGKRTRVREVNFVRVEDSSIHDVLSPFEMEVRDRIVRDDIRFDFKQQSIRAKAAHRKSLEKKLYRLIQGGGLTKRQREFYELFYVQKLKDSDIAMRLGVSSVRIRKLRWQLKQKLKKTKEIQNEKENLHRKLRNVRLTKKQKEIWRLYYTEGLTPVQIALKFGKTRQTIYWILQKLRKIFST